MNHRFAPIVAVIFTLAGCGGSSTPASPGAMPPVASPVASPAGSWSGSMSDPISGEGTARLSLTEQSQNSLTGSWSATFQRGDTLSGPAIGFLVQPTTFGIALYADPPPPCATGSGPGSGLLSFTLVNVVVTSSQLTAVLGRLSCSGSSFGTLSLTKQ
jgi:hypothetical protein